MDIQIYKTKGEPLGFIRNDNLYSINGKALGWKDGEFIWNKQGQFCGRLYYLDGNNFIIKFLLDLKPLPQPSKDIPDIPSAETPVIPKNIEAIALPAGYEDGF